MSNIYNKNKNNDVFDILSLILSDDKKKLKDIVLENPQIAMENNFHLLMLACWCANHDIVNFLIQDECYFIKAFQNQKFSYEFSQLKKFNPENYYTINAKYQSTLFNMYLNNEIPLNNIESNISKF